MLDAPVEPPSRVYKPFNSLFEMQTRREEVEGGGGHGGPFNSLFEMHVSARSSARSTGVLAFQFSI